MPTTKARLKQKVKDAKFLVEQFDIGERQAADLIAEPGSDEARQIKHEVSTIESDADPLAGTPTPKDTLDHPAHSNDGKLKPVIRHANERVGGG
jgi:hypothetical protein